MKIQDFFVIFIFGHFFCPFLRILKKSWKKKIKKKLEKIVTIKKIKVRTVKKILRICYHNFFINLLFFFEIIGDFLVIIQMVINGNIKISKISIYYIVSIIYVNFNNIINIFTCKYQK